MRLKYLIISLLAVFVSGCTQERGENEILIGTIAGPETALVEVAKDVAKTQYNLDIKIIEFEDYITPNTALDEGSIDANMYQHQPFLDLAIENRGYKLTAIGKMFIYPMGAYSKKYKSIADISDGAVVAIPNDPSNGARALRLLARENLIAIPDVNDLKLTPKAITHNPKKLKFQELDAAQLPRVLDDVDFAIINTNYAMPSGLHPQKDAFILESKDSPYANIIVIKTQDMGQEKYNLLVKALQSEPVKNKAFELFSDSAIVAW